MKRIIDLTAAVIIVTVVLMALLAMIKPYIPWLLGGLGIVLFGNYIYQRRKNW